MYVLHIGLPKTGTSTLQDLMAFNVEPLRTRGIIYPVLGGGRPRPHRELRRAILEREGITAPVWSEFRALRDEARQQTVVASCEGLSNLRLDPRVVREGIKGEEAQVIVYVRDLFAWIVSSYCQMVKQGEQATSIESFDRYLIEAMKGKIRHAERILPWAEAFGRDNVRVRSLDPDCLVNGNLIDDFLAALGTTRRGLVIPPNANDTPDWRVVELLREMRAQHFVETGGERKRDPRALRQMTKFSLAAGERLGWRERAEYLTREQRRLLAALYHADRDRLLAAIPNSRISDIVFDLDRDRPFLPSPEVVPEADRRAFEAVFAKIQAERAPAAKQHRLHKRAKQYYKRLKERLWPRAPEVRQATGER